MEFVFHELYILQCVNVTDLITAQFAHVFH